MYRGVPKLLLRHPCSSFALTPPAGKPRAVVGTGAVIVVAAVQRNHVSLEVLGKVVICPGGFAGILDGKAHRGVVLVQGVAQGVQLHAGGVEPLLRHGFAVDEVILGIAAVRVAFPSAHAVDIVLIAIGFSAHCGAVQLPSVAPAQGVGPAVVVAQGVATAVVGDAVAVKGREQVLPVGVPVGVGVLHACDAACAVLNLPRGQVSGVVIIVLIPVPGRTIRRVIRGVLHLPQLVIGELPIGAVHQIGDLGDISHLVIAVPIPRQLGGTSSGGGVEGFR